MNAEELKDRLLKKGRMSFLEGATKEQIAVFEEKTGEKLPEQYQEWLLISDGGEFYLPAGVQLYGVAHKPLIDVTDNDRPSEQYILIGALSTGDPILYEKGTERISVYNHEAGVIESDETYTDFFSFLDALGELLGIGG